MNLLEVVNQIRTGGGRIFIEAGEVLIEAPVGVVTPEARAVLVASRETLLALLAPPGRTSATPAAFQEPEPELIAESLPPLEAEARLVDARREWWQMVLDEIEERRAAEEPPPPPPPPEIPATITSATEWAEPGGGRSIIPAGTVGRIAIDLGEIPDLHRREQVSATLAAKAREGEPALPVLLAGSVRVLPASLVRVGR
jgi:hypothetical protein